jgi:predicted transcriptional regulator of viral defense system
MTDKGYTQSIINRIDEAEEGSVFVSSDFADIANTDTIRRSLNRMTQRGILRRVIEGVYEKPKYSQLLDEYVTADPDLVAKAIARNYHWTIAPSGLNALNLLGLSTQVPSVWTYVSDGPYRNFRWGNTQLKFKTRTNKEITGLSYTTTLVVQALKTLGKEGVTPEIVQRLRSRLSKSDKKVLLEEASESTDWVYDLIRQVCESDNK